MDTETGEVQVLKLVSAFDTGRAINPLLVEGQIEGGAVMGMGAALMENLHSRYPSRDGKPDNLNTYVIPKAAGTPRSIKRYSVQMQLVLVHPEIPHNTGCVARLAAATGARLHLVEPLGFSLEDRYLKRAGLDYWPMVDAVVHADWGTAAEFLSSEAERPLSERLRLFTARGGRSLFETDFGKEDLLVFGSESAGLPAALLEAHGDRRVYVPIREAVRSLNLANTVCLGLYTAINRAGLPLPDNDGRYVAHPDAGEEVLPGECMRRPPGCSRSR